MVASSSFVGLGRLGQAKVGFRYSLPLDLGEAPETYVLTWEVGADKGWRKNSVDHIFRKSVSDDETLRLSWSARTGGPKRTARALVSGRWEWTPEGGYELQDWERAVVRGKAIVEEAVRGVTTDEFWARYGEGR